MPEERPGPIRRIALACMGMDPRSLAAFRVCLGLIILVDTLFRVQHMEAHYADTGVLPRDEYLDKFMGKWIWSFHLISGHVYWQGTLFAIQALAGFCLLVGYRTRVANFVAWMFAISLQARMPMVLQAGDVLLRVLLFWAMFLPLNAKWSVDAALGQLKQKVPVRILTWGTFALLAQVVGVYWYSIFWKTGKEWWGEGSAVYFALHIDHFATPLAVALRENFFVTQLFTWSTLVVESVVVGVGAFCPWGPARFLACITVMGMHIGFILTMKIGLFWAISSCCWIPFLPPWFWDKSAAILAKRTAKIRSITLRVLAGDNRIKLLKVLRHMLMLDGKVELEMVDPATGGMPAGRRWVAVVDGQPLVREAAVGALFKFSPLFFIVSFMGPLLYFIYSMVDTVIVGINRVFRRPARAGILGDCLTGSMPKVRISMKQSIVGSLVVAFLTAYVVWWNLAAYKKTKLPMDRDYKVLAWTLRLDQKWNMFAPFPMKGDGWFIVPGLLHDGTQTNVWEVIDGQTTPVTFEKPAMVSEMYPSQRWRKYTMNIWLKKYKKHRLYFGRWICREWNATHSDPKQKLDGFHIMYMKELTTLNGPTKPKCITLWRHWCTNAAKHKYKKKTMSYETECKTHKGPPKAAKQGAAKKGTAKKGAAKPTPGTDIKKPAIPLPLK